MKMPLVLILAFLSQGLKAQDSLLYRIIKPNVLTDLTGLTISSIRKADCLDQKKYADYLRSKNTINQHQFTIYFSMSHDEVKKIVGEVFSKEKISELEKERGAVTLVCSGGGKVLWLEFYVHANTKITPEEFSLLDQKLRARLRISIKDPFRDFEMCPAVMFQLFRYPKEVK